MGGESGIGNVTASVRLQYEPDPNATATARLDRLGTMTYHEAYWPNLANPSLTTTYGYDGMGRVSRIEHRRATDLPGVHPPSELLETSYHANGLVGREKRANPFSDASYHPDVTYTYDAVGQVTSSQTDGGTPQEFKFDDGGNPAGYPAPQPGNRAHIAGGWRLVYDPEGNVTWAIRFAPHTATVEAWRYEYDHANRLVAVEKGTAAFTSYPSSWLPSNVRYTFRYDAEGRLVEMSEATGANPVVLERYAHDGANVRADLNAAGAAKARYLRGDGADQLFALQYQSGGVSNLAWYLTDRQGSVLQIVAGNTTYGTLLKAVAYAGAKAVGRMPSPQEGGPLSDRHEYTGRPYYREVYLQHNRGRWYDPSTSRWTSEDPIGFASGDTNLYRYVGNSHPNATDPSGHFGVVGGIVGAVIGGIAGGVMTAYGNPSASWGDIFYAAGKGAAIGGLVGFTGGLAGGAVSAAAAWLGASSVVAGVAGAASGVVGAVYSDMLGQYGGWQLDQATGMGPGAKARTFDDAYRWEQTVGAGVGGVFSSATGAIWAAAGRQAAGQAAATGARQLGGYGSYVVGGLVSGFSGDVVGQGLEKGWGKIDWGQAALSAGFGAAGGAATRGLAGWGLQHYHDHGRWSGRLAQMLVPEAKLLGYKVCFAAGTPLLTPEGSKPIEQFQVGDLVLARDESNPDGPAEAKAVEEVFVRSGFLLHLHAGGQVVRTTSEHPFYVRGGGWVQAALLRPGDLLSSHDGRWIEVEEVYDTGEYETVYNLRVADFHTYFVGCDEWGFSVWAHNAACTPEEIVAYADSFAEAAQGNGGKVPRGVWERIAPGRKLSEGDKSAIRHRILSNPDLYPGVTIKPRGMGGPIGNPSTRTLDGDIAQHLKSGGWKLERGAGSGHKQEWIPGSGPGRTGGTAVDVTASRVVDGTVQRVRGYSGSLNLCRNKEGKEFRQEP